MIPVFIVILIGVFIYLWWMRTHTTLTRNCRWRQEKSAGLWRCAYCGAEIPDEGRPPRICAEKSAPRT